MPHDPKPERVAGWSILIAWRRTLSKRKDIILCCDCEGTWAELDRLHRAIQSVGIAANFFFVGDTVRQHRELVREIASTHQADCHTDTHPNLRRLSKEAQRSEIVRGRRAVEDLLGRPVRGFRAPYHHLNQDTVDILNEERFVFDASMLYFHYSPGALKEIKPSWFREWMPLYDQLRLTPRAAFGIFRTIVRARSVSVLPAHPQYAGRDDKLAGGFQDFLQWGVDQGVRFWRINEYLEHYYQIPLTDSPAAPCSAKGELSVGRL